MTTNKETNEEIIQLWTEKNIHRCSMNFSCGGDSMGDTDFTLYDKDDNVVFCSELTDYFENEVYNEVNFYEVSDGQYMGESGIVTITLEDDGEGEMFFEYGKESQSEWEESFTSIMEIYLIDDEVKLLTEKISNINGNDFENNPNINFKDDCVLTDEEETLLDDLVSKIVKMSSDFDIEGKGEEVDENRNFDTGDDGEGVTIKGNILEVSVTARFFFTEVGQD